MPVIVKRGEEDLIMAQVFMRLKARQKAMTDAATIDQDALGWQVKARPYIHNAPFVVPHPLQALYSETSPEVAVMKASQVMVSEWLISMAFWCADTIQGGRGNVLYIFPAIAQLGDFVRARVDTAIEQSVYLRTKVKSIKGSSVVGEGKLIDNVGLKRLGQGFIYFRGSNAQAGLISVDADLVLYDEVDRLTQGTLSLGSKRLGSSTLGWQRYASTPVYPNAGIDSLWLKSDKRRYHVKCEHCGTWQMMSFPDNLREDGLTICVKCRDRLDRLAQGEWVAEDPTQTLKGYHITRFMSPRANMKVLADTGYRILAKDETSQSAVQEFYNQDLGLPHTPAGGQLSRSEIEACIADYGLDEWAPTGCSMGVDVGTKLHVRVDKTMLNGKARAAFIGSVMSFEDLDVLMRRFDVSYCVIDAAPEGHSARQFANRWPGRVWLCRYAGGDAWSRQELAVWSDVDSSVLAHRTLVLDAMFARVRERQVEYPREVLDLPEFVDHMLAQIRVVEQQANGNFSARYVDAGKPDHFGHAETYAWIASQRPTGAVDQVVFYHDPVEISPY